MKRQASGFTLLELIVATAIFSLVGAMAYTGLTGALKIHEAAKENTDRVREIQRGWFVLTRDFSLATARASLTALFDSFGS